jgi:putative transposase
MIEQNHDLPITRQAPMAKGFVYLTAVLDVASHKVLTHKVAVTLKACHAVNILKEAFVRYGRPEIVNTDQGSQFTAEEFTSTVLRQCCKLSMDGKGAWRDNVFVERVWRSAKYDEIYLHAYDGVSQASSAIAQYFNWYNQSRPHLSLQRQTPDEAYDFLMPKMAHAA